MADCCALPSSAPPPVMACPACGRRSKKVDTITVKSLVRRLPFGMAPVQYYFCGAPACDVGLFSLESQCADVRARRPVGASGAESRA